MWIVLPSANLHSAFAGGLATWPPTCARLGAASASTMAIRHPRLAAHLPTLRISSPGRFDLMPLDAPGLRFDTPPPPPPAAAHRSERLTARPAPQTRSPRSTAQPSPRPFRCAPTRTVEN